MERKNLFLGLLILGTAFWGISFSVTKLAIGGFSPAVFMFYRFMGATLILAVVFRKEVARLNWLTIKAGVGLAIPLVLGIYLQTLGVMHSPAAQCSFVAGIAVVMVPLLKLLVYRKMASVKIWIASVIALTGLFIISVKDGLHISIGDLFTVSGAAAFSMYMIRVERQAKASSIIPTIVPMFAGCTLFAFIIALTGDATNWAPSSNLFWMGVVYCAIFSTAFMYTISNISQKYISAERVAIIYLFEPVFGAIAAFFILGEAMTWRLLLGGGLIFAATLISELDLKRYRRRLSVTMTE